MKFHITVAVLSLLSSTWGNVNNDVNDVYKDTSYVSSPLPLNAEREANAFIRELKQRNGQDHKNHRRQQQHHHHHQQQQQIQSGIDHDSLKNCDPDVGILSCGEQEYCIDKISLGMEGLGGLCIPLIDEDLDHTMNQKLVRLMSC
jgi:hypothetical protein